MVGPNKVCARKNWTDDKKPREQVIERGNEIDERKSRQFRINNGPGRRNNYKKPNFIKTLK